MKHMEYPIGFWNILSATQLGPEAVSDWKDFGTTLTMTGQYDPSQDKERFIAVLDECARQNIRLLISDQRIGYDMAAQEDYRKRVRQVVEDFGWHPAVYADDEDGKRRFRFFRMCLEPACCGLQCQGIYRDKGLSEDHAGM